MRNSADTSPKPIDLLVSGGFVLTMDAEDTTHYPGSVAINDGQIVSIGASSEVDSAFVPAHLVDATDCVIMPGLINIHGHASNSLIRSLGRDLPLHEWLEKVCWPCMFSADDEDLYNGVLLSCLEMLLNGITTFADMWPGVGLSARAVETSGQRAMLAHNIKDFGDRAQGERELTIGLEAWEAWNGHAGGRVMVGLAPHSVYTCQPDLVAECAHASRDKGIHLQVHANESLHEVEISQAQYGRSPIQLLADKEFLGPDTIVAHAVHVSESDIVLLRDSGSSVSHNIASNLILASGIAPVQRYLDEGVRVGIGTDGPGSNDGLDLLADLKMAALLQKGVTSDATSVPADAALAMVTRHGAEALGIGDQTGTLEVWKKADIILLDLDKPHLTPRHYDIPASIAALLVNCATGRDVDTVIVNGEILVADGQPRSLDVMAIQQKAQKSSEKVRRAAKID